MLKLQKGFVYRILSKHQDETLIVENLLKEGKNNECKNN